MTMSTRPVAASIRGVNVVVTPPWRMNVPSLTIRTRSTFGLNVTVSVTTDRRDTLLIDSGAVYGPPATRNSVPGVVMMTCAAVAFGEAVPGAAGGVVVMSRVGGVAGGAATSPGTPPGVGTPAPAGGAPVVGGAAPGAAPAGFTVPPGAPGKGVTSVGTGDVPGGTAGFVGGTPGGDRSGGREPVASPPPGAGAPLGGEPGSSAGAGPMSGGGPPSPMFCCVPI